MSGHTSIEELLKSRGDMERLGERSFTVLRTSVFLIDVQKYGLFEFAWAYVGREVSSLVTIHPRNDEIVRR